MNAPSNNGHAVRRDAVVIGASAGGLNALKDIVGSLPADLPAAVLVVLHVSADRPSMLPDILSRAGPLPACHARDGEPVEHGRIYVAPPDFQMTLAGGNVRVQRGPRENRLRPAADVLFRSAAVAYGPRVIGVVLSGSLDDGTAGLSAVKLAGGVAVVQDPEQTAFPSMPESALGSVDVDYVRSSLEIGHLLVRLTKEEIAAMPADDETLQTPASVREEHAEYASEQEEAPAYSCPDCGGVLREFVEARHIHYRCRVGHAYSPDSLLASQSESMEHALWAALRAMEESVEVSRRLASRSRVGGHDPDARRYDKKAEDLVASATVIRDVLYAPGVDAVAS